MFFRISGNVAEIGRDERDSYGKNQKSETLLPRGALHAFIPW